MLTWDERENAQEKAAGPVDAVPAAKAPFGTPFDRKTDGRATSMRVPAAFSVSHDRPRHAIVEPSPPDADGKAVATLAAQFALAGHEMRVIDKAGRRYFEVRRLGQCRTCSTLHDLRGFLAAQIGGATQ